MRNISVTSGDGMFMGAEYWVQQRVASCPRESPPQCETSQNTKLSSVSKAASDTINNYGPRNNLESEYSEKEVHGLEFHFDKDEQAAEDDVWLHPKYSTATYLDARIEGFPPGGAPLIVFRTNSEEEEEEEGEGGEEGEGFEEENEGEEDDDDDDDAPDLIDLKTPPHPKESIGRFSENSQIEEEDALESDPRTPRSAWVVFPKVNRHVSFPGGFLHGVAGELLQPSLLLSANKLENSEKSMKVSKHEISTEFNNDYNYSRLSLLVNIWVDHHPKKVVRINHTEFSSQLNNRKFAEEKTEGKIKIKTKTEKNKKTSGHRNDFKFDRYVKNLKKSDEEPFLSYNLSSKIDSSSGESTGPSSLKKRIKLRDINNTPQNNFEEIYDDGILFAAGNGMDKLNTIELWVEVKSSDEITGHKEQEKEKSTELACIRKGIKNENDIGSFDNKNEKIKVKENVNKNVTNDSNADIKKRKMENEEDASNEDQTNNDDSSTKHCKYYLREHRNGDTGPIPLDMIKEQFKRNNRHRSAVTSNDMRTNKKDVKELDLISEVQCIETKEKLIHIKYSYEQFLPFI